MFYPASLRCRLPAANSSVLALLAAILLVTPAIALAGTEYDWAPVTGVSPVYEIVTLIEPHEECRDERVAYSPGQASATPSILGAIVGGALGNAVGHKKRNKQVGVVVGALLGGSIGADIARHNRGYEPVSYGTRTRCHVVEQTRREERLAGYDVTYEYGGTTYRTRMERDPGERVRVQVRVTPVG